MTAGSALLNPLTHQQCNHIAAVPLRHQPPSGVIVPTCEEYCLVRQSVAQHSTSVSPLRIESVSSTYQLRSGTSTPYTTCCISIAAALLPVNAGSANRRTVARYHTKGESRTHSGSAELCSQQCTAKHCGPGPKTAPLTSSMSISM